MLNVQTFLEEKEMQYQMKLELTSDRYYMDIPELELQISHSSTNEQLFEIYENRYICDRYEVDQNELDTVVSALYQLYKYGQDKNENAALWYQQFKTLVNTLEKE